METKQETCLSLVHRVLSLNQPIFNEHEQTNKARKSKQREIIMLSKVALKGAETPQSGMLTLIQFRSRY